jgi:membrane protein YdbS with pleckstrin-like domain
MAARAYFASRIGLLMKLKRLRMKRMTVMVAVAVVVVVQLALFHQIREFTPVQHRFETCLLQQLQRLQHGIIFKEIRTVPVPCCWFKSNAMSASSRMRSQRM